MAVFRLMTPNDAEPKVLRVTGGQVHCHCRGGLGSGTGGHSIELVLLHCAGNHLPAILWREPSEVTPFLPHSRHFSDEMTLRLIPGPNSE